MSIEPVRVYYNHAAYDIPSSFVESHPGGPEAIVHESGKDITELWNSVSAHGETAAAVLKGFAVAGNQHDNQVMERPVDGEGSKGSTAAEDDESYEKKPQQRR